MNFDVWPQRKPSKNISSFHCVLNKHPDEGNSKTTIVANVSGDSHSLGETLSTLKFAQRAKLIQNKARVNEDTSGATVTQLHEEIRKLKAQLANNNLNSTSISSDLISRCSLLCILGV